VDSLKAISSLTGTTFIPSVMKFMSRIGKDSFWDALDKQKFFYAISDIL